MTEALLHALEARANRRGLVLAQAAKLELELGASHEQLVRALDRLVADDRIDLLSPSPWLVIRLRSWGGKRLPRTSKQQQSSGTSQPSHIEVPVSSSAAAAAMHTEDGGAGEGGPLLAEVLAVLGGDARPAEFRSLIAGHDPRLVRRCLDRVRATARIRVSRAALFRSLLQKLSH